MKKSLLLLLLFLASSICGTITAQEFLHDGIYYRVIAPGEVELAYASEEFYSGEASQRPNLVIPESVTYNEESYSVVKIQRYALGNCQGLVSVTIPNSVRIIGEFAFQGDEKLKTVTFGNSVSSIEEGAFNFCTSLMSISLPNSVNSLGGMAFANCCSLSSVTLSESLATIGTYAFSGCTSLTSIDIPDSVTYIGDEAFIDCPLVSVHIGNGVSEIGSSIFDSRTLEELYVGTSLSNIEDGLGLSFCFKLTTIVVAAGNPYYLTQDNILYNKDKTRLIFCGRNATNVVVPNSVNVIGYRAFVLCESLTTVSMGNSVTEIEEAAFCLCESLTTINLSESLTEIGTNVFGGCSALKSIDIPDNIRSIGDGAFEGCKSLENINFGGGIESLDRRAFAGCDALKSVKLPNSVKFMGEGVFQYCKSLESVILSSSVDSIKLYTFMECTSLKNIDLANVKYLGYAFRECSSLENVEIPASVDSIDASFVRCSNLKSINVDPDNSKYSSKDGVLYTKDMTGLVAYPAGLTEIKFESSVNRILENAFGLNLNITSLVIPDNVEIIEGFVFSICENLASVTIGKSVKSIGMDCFPWAGKVKVVNCRAEEPPVCADRALVSLDVNSTVIFVPEGSLSKYKESVRWGDFANIEEKDYSSGINYDFESEGGLFNITSAGENLTVEIVGAAINNEEPQNTSSRIYSAPGKVLAIPETIDWNGETYTVTSIGKNAFTNDMSIERVEIPATVTTIRDNAFSGCSKIRTVKCDAVVPPSCGVDVWDKDVIDKASLHVPEGTASVYNNAETWCEFAYIFDHNMSGIDEVGCDTGVSVVNGNIILAKDANVEVFDTTGRKVYEKKKCSSISGLEEGVYIIRIADKTFKIKL